jgi:xylulokinase
MPLVAGVDSSTQSVKVVIRDADSGELIAQASEPHPDGTEVDPRAWEDALEKALTKVSRFKFDAISIAGQQHGMVALDNGGEVIRKALLWNDTRSAKAAEELNKEIPDIHLRTGSRLVASFTASKVRWLFDAEPENAKRLAAVALPHDWLSWRLMGSKDLEQLFTDRSDASGTGYFNLESNEYDKEVIQTITSGNKEFLVPKVLKPNAFGGETKDGIPIGAGAGDNAAAALGLGAKVGDLVISLGTSGTAFAVSEKPTKDSSGEVAGFADATGNFLPLACTLNAAKVFASVARMLNVNLDEFSALSLSAKAGAGGIRLLPHFDGERTPNRPNARGNYLGITNENLIRENLARAAIEGVIAGMVYAANSLKREGFTPNRILLIGGAAKNKAVQEITASMFATSIYLPNAGEYVADGAAKQAAWALSGKNELPNWEREKLETIQPIDSNQDLISEYLDLISKV